MEQAITLDHFDAVLKFLRSNLSFSALIAVSEKMKNGHPAFSRTKVFVDNLAVISTVVIDEGGIIEFDPEEVHLMIFMKDTNLKINCQLIDQSFPLEKTLLYCCRQSVTDSMVQSLNRKFSLVASTVTYILPQKTRISPSCPAGYSFRRATQVDASYFHSTWKFAASQQLTPFTAGLYANILVHLPSVVVIKKEKDKEIIVGCGMQDLVGCIAKVYVDESHRRCGLASFIVCELSSQIRAAGDLMPPHAYVEKDNAASASVFEKLEFDRHNDTIVWGRLLPE